jgi:hypothetical protein
MEEKGKGTLVNPRITVIACMASVVVASLALASSASAAFAPKLAVTIDPPTQRSKVAITTTVTQAADETANKTVVVNFPDDWGTAANELTACTDADAQASKCPATSKMGSAIARNPLLGELSGNVNIGTTQPDGKIKIWVYLNNAVLHQIIPGVVGISEKGTFVSKFDNLPDVLTTFFQLKLDGPPRSLAETGFGCGDRFFSAEFTSQKNEKATSQAKVTIGGCPDRPPVVSSFNFGKLTTANGGKASFALDQAATVAITVTKKGSDKVLQAFNLTGKEGTNKFKGLGKGLPKGKYYLRIKATDSGGQVRNKKFTFRVSR